MKGYRTPSWFRKKKHIKESQAKAQTGKFKRAKTKSRL